MKTFWLIAALLLCACSGSIVDTASSPEVVAPDDTLSAANCPSNNVWRHAAGSWIISSPSVHLIFWGDWWVVNKIGIALFAKENQTWNTLANDPAFYTPAREYGVGTGQLSGIFNADWDVASGAMQEDAIQRELVNEINTGVLPTSTDQSIYVIMMPPDTQSQLDASHNYGGHHSYLMTPTNNFTYAVIENVSNLDYVISHEIYEAATNPDLSDGWWGPGGNTEVADICENGSATNLDGAAIARIWSEAKCECVP